MVVRYRTGLFGGGQSEIDLAERSQINCLMVFVKFE